MFKKAGKGKAIRRKVETDDVDEQPEAEIEESVVKRTSLKKKKTPSSKKSLALSFNQEDEGEGEVFKIEKSNASKRLEGQRALHVPSLEPPEDINQINLTPSYTNEMLQQLRNSTPSTPKAMVDAGLAQDDDALLVASKFPSTLGASLSSGSSIPDANAIHAAKKRRELMRQGIKIQDDDFIALDEGEPENQSRLVREEDEDDDAEDEYEKYVGDKLALGKKAQKQQEASRKAGVREMIEDAEEDDSELDELDRWEQEMIKFGGVRTKKIDESESSEINRNYRPAPIPEQTAIPSLSDVLSRLSIVSSNLEESKQNHDKQLTQTLKDIENLKATRDVTESELERTGKRYNYFQELKAFVNDLAEFLDVKFPELEKVESQFYGLMNQRTKAVENRRWQDDLDDAELFSDVPATFTIAEDDGELDEFGRSSSSRNSEAAKRRRREERTSRHILRETSDDITGLSTDDELDQSYAREEREELDEIQRDKINAIIADVQDDFSSLLSVKNKFESWKTEFNDDYTKAYGGLSLPGAFEFYIRIELITWNPFLRPVDLDTMRWHTIISEYGVANEQEDDAMDDPDSTILNKVVEKTVCKKIKDMIPNLDVFSAAQMKSAKHAIEQVSYYVEDHEPAFKELATSALDHFSRTVTQYLNLVDAIHLHDGEPDDAAKKARNRLLKRMIKVYKNLRPWRRLITLADPHSSIFDDIHDKMLVKLVAPWDGDLELLL
ncbi:hypothetical protein INT44_006970 [Umbelopsis vinacea]|uniref:GCF C-terminal domain-containing protein n=1 Tax=Umbelopsis vinacea TaxID=44442 RepID=A0A8H7PFH7_9FUNG|nr:hypothetical protein INT44_006970 [Umbelopsis vinacea]